MRLIDAEKLIEEFSGTGNFDSVEVRSRIAFAPTAYDIDGVVKQLKRCYGIVRSNSVDYAEGLKDAYERSIDIVKAGAKQ
jgi:hypothetical protein